MKSFALNPEGMAMAIMLRLKWVANLTNAVPPATLVRDFPPPQATINPNIVAKIAVQITEWAKLLLLNLFTLASDYRTKSSSVEQGRRRPELL